MARTYAPSAAARPNYRDAANAARAALRETLNASGITQVRTPLNRGGQERFIGLDANGARVRGFRDASGDIMLQTRNPKLDGWSDLVRIPAGGGDMSVRTAPPRPVSRPARNEPPPVPRAKPTEPLSFVEAAAGLSRLPPSAILPPAAAPPDYVPSRPGAPVPLPEPKPSRPLRRYTGKYRRRPREDE